MGCALSRSRCRAGRARRAINWHHPARACARLNATAGQLVGADGENAGRSVFEVAARRLELRRHASVAHRKRKRLVRKQRAGVQCAAGATRVRIGRARRIEQDSVAAHHRARCAGIRRGRGHNRPPWPAAPMRSSRNLLTWVCDFGRFVHSNSGKGGCWARPCRRRPSRQLPGRDRT